MGKWCEKREDERREWRVEKFVFRQESLSGSILIIDGKAEPISKTSCLLTAHPKLPGF